MISLLRHGLVTCFLLCFLLRTFVIGQFRFKNVMRRLLAVLEKYEGKSNKNEENWFFSAKTNYLYFLLVLGSLSVFPGLKHHHRGQSRCMISLWRAERWCHFSNGWPLHPSFTVNENCLLVSGADRRRYVGVYFKALIVKLSASAVPRWAGVGKVLLAWV